MKNIKILFIYITILSVFFVSCTKDKVEIETEEQEIASLEDYFNFMHEETSVNVFVQSYTTNVDPTHSHNISASIEGDKKPMDIDIEGHLYSFNKFSYSDTKKRTYSTGNNPDLNSLDLQNIYGKKLKIEVFSDKLKATGDAASSNSVESVYIPKLIDANFTGLSNGNIVAGTKVKWNADGLNTNGIVVGVEYSPNALPNASISKTSSEHLITGITLPDNGEYTFTVNDLSYFPNNAYLDFYVARAGFGVTLDNEGKDYAISAMTVSKAMFPIQK